MKPKNVMLLGFVNSAIEYLDKHMDEEPNTRLSQLKNIDLASIKEELNNHLDASLGTMQSTMSTLLRAGNEAFSEYVIGTYGEVSVPEQLDRMFDVDFDEETAVSKQDELAKLLSFYNLDLDSDDIKYHEDDISVNDDKFMEEIVKNASNEIEQVVEQPLVVDDKNDEEIDSIFNEIVENENINDVLPVENVEVNQVDETSSLINELREKLIQEEEARKQAELALIEEKRLAEEKRLVEEAAKKAEEERIAEEARLAEEEAKKVQAEAAYRPYFSSLMEQLKDQMIKEEEEEKQRQLIEEQKRAEEQKRLAEEAAKKAEEERIAEEARLAEEAAKKAEEERIAEEARIEEEKRLAEEQAKKEAEEAEANKPYVSSLIEELKDKLVKEEQDRKDKADRNKPIYDEISQKYTNLPMSFIVNVYDLKETLAYDYKDGQDLIVLHRINFKDVEELRRFVEISMKHNYNVNADEKKMIVDTFKEVINGDGVIITNIFEVANQAFLLNGTYEGYNVINNDIE